MPGGPVSAQPPLLDLLGARWALGAPVLAIAWSADQATLAAGLADGGVAIARTAWEGAAMVAPRQGGGLEVVPPNGPPPPVSRLHAHDGGCQALLAWGDGFASGGQDGVVAAISADGTRREVTRHPGAFTDLLAVGAGRLACAVGRVVHIDDAPPLRLPGSAMALAFDPDGARLAVAHYRGATVWSAAAPLRLLDMPGCPRSIAWSPDGAYLICGLQENALHGWRLDDAGAIEMGGYPTQPRSLSFAADGSFLASSGAPRVVCWRFDPPGQGQGPMECGLAASRAPVCVVACHPRLTLIASGYHNGAVLLCRPGSEDVLFVRASGGGSVAALAWSGDGGRLAMATEGGELGFVALPEAMFRNADQARWRPA